MLGAGKGITTSSDRSNDFVAAASRGDTVALMTMLNDGVDINSVDTLGYTALLAATVSNSVPTLKWLISKGAKIDHFDPNNKPIDYTPFLYAGAYGFDEVLDVLIPLEPNVKLLNGYGGNALIPACEKGHVSTVKKLLERTAVEVNLINNLGWTALLESIILSDAGVKQQEIIKLLLANGADPNIADSDGITPLHHAEKKDYVEIVKIIETTLNKNEK